MKQPLTVPPPVNVKASAADKALAPAAAASHAQVFRGAVYVGVFVECYSFVFNSFLYALGM